MTAINIHQPDVTLLLDLAGVIKEATLSQTIGGEGVEGWLGRRWEDTISDPASDTIGRMMEDARRVGVSAFRQITQRFPSGLELPMEYTMVRLGGGAGLIAVGKNIQAVAELQSRLIAAQQEREQEYWKLREIETRYRVLFDTSDEAVALVDPETMLIVDANPAAARSLGLASGRELLVEVAPPEQEAFRTMLARARQHGRTPGIRVHLGAAHTPWRVRASLSASERGPVFVIHFTRAGAALQTPDPGDGATDRAILEDLVQRLPDGFVIADHKGTIRSANFAFLDLVQAGSEAAVIGESLGRWLSQPGADLSILLSVLRQYQVARGFNATLQGELGSETAVEIAAIGGGRPQAIAVVLRDVSRRLLVPGDASRLSSALAPISERLGETPLVELVKDTANAMEQHYIKLALARTDGNRTAAAELLQISRQGLYAKLNRYGLDKRPDVAAE